MCNLPRYNTTMKDWGKQFSLGTESIENEKLFFGIAKEFYRLILKKNSHGH